MSRVCDYSFARPDPLRLRADGFVSVGRYLGQVGDGRALTLGERDRLHGAGLSIWLIRESHGGEILEGYASGLQQGAIARRCADELEWPADRPVYATADTMVRPGQYAVAGEYLKGFRGGLGGRPVGLYGGARLIQWALQQGLAEFGWAAGASFWHDGVAPAASGAHIEQLANQLYNGAIDDGRTLRADWGAWLPGTEHPQTEEDTLTPELEAKLDELAAGIVAALLKTVEAVKKDTNQAVDDGVRNLADNAQGNVANSILQVRNDIAALKDALP